MSRRLLGLFALALAPVVAGPLRLAAQAAIQPAVTVVAFDADQSTGFSLEERQDMADELAVRFVETGRFRVLEREWLPVRKDTPGPLPLTALRAAATSAGVEYLVLGCVRRASAFTTRPPGPGSALLRAMAGGSRFGRPSAPYESFLSVSVRVIDVTSGAVVRTSVARANATAPRLAPAVILPGMLLRRPAGALVAVATMEARSSRLNGGVQHALADIAHTLNLAVTSRPDAR
jgi:curli biogenesis system outer membrane secretion channel CsgG